MQATMMSTLRLPLDQYRALVEHSPVMIWRAGLDAKCNYFNDTWLAFTGRTLQQELGDGWTEGVHPEDAPRCMQVFQSSFARREAFEMEYRLRRRDGVHRYIFDRGVPFEDEQGRFAGYIGSCVDVHERREVERKKEAFLTLIAHELRTPLTSMRTYAEVLRRQLARAQGGPPEALGRLMAQIERFEDLVAELSGGGLLSAGRSVAGVEE